MLPDFLCIGAQKAGTTWLDAALRRMEDVALPARRKEVHFFDRHFARGPDWYRGFFPDPSPGLRAVGEVTPSYLFDPDVPARIRAVLGAPRLIVLLRDPVARLESHYRMDWSRGETDAPLDTFLDPAGAPFRRGLYAEQLGRYVELFDPESLLVLVFEEVFAGPAAQKAALRRILTHIGSAADPAEGVRAGRVNAAVSSGRAARFGLYRAADRTARWLRRHDFDGVVNLGKRLGLGEASFGARTRPPPRLDAARRESLRALYEPDIRRLEAMLGRRLDVWRGPAGKVVA